VLVYGRATLGLAVPPALWPILGGVFMFRLIVYVYDVGHATERPRLRDYLAYFFLLPNYYFLLFPVVDFQTMRRSYFRRDIHEVAQQGIQWMVRGTIQLLLYRVVYHLKGVTAPDQITTFGALAGNMVLTYLLYLRVSGQFHIAVGMLHLFGYDLPETHRRYLLASSIAEFWRRINIYWKDFMVKVVYLPTYFKLRKRGDLLAQVIAVAAVFAATWLLHVYQSFWLRGVIAFSWPDTLFWAILAGLVIGQTLSEHSRTRNRSAARHGVVGRVLQTAGTFILITVLWSLWNAPSLTDWVDVLTWWKIGA
jgi:alginate O-acetyltransferase complex protein AlgI